MVDFSEGTYNVSISGGNNALCAGDCSCDAEFTAVTFEHGYDGHWWFWGGSNGDAVNCEGITTVYHSISGAILEDVDGALVARFVSYVDTPCGRVDEEQYSVVNRGLEFSELKGREEADGRIVFHSDTLNVDLTLVKATGTQDDVAAVDDGVDVQELEVTAGEIEVPAADQVQQDVEEKTDCPCARTGNVA
ncbi:hypothetical protein [Anaplasma capra]|uniref:hypothetical protein n=1 Tax=Anaplasma capra TaxID=1562740 RepID=UPI0021D60309|nr:hypothetical protein [Anaplasma capra]MCU7611150.1 hypothetical protein [Anaplasma capra]MCU7612346.1 hypothetical protein [Anaplasma capra]